MKHFSLAWRVPFREELREVKGERCMEKRKVCLFINPRDGQNLVKLTAILAVLAAADCETRIALKEYASHAQELAWQAAQDGCDLVIVYGGDGTLNRVVNGIVNAKNKPRVGVIAGGTANLWATEIGMPIDNPVKAVLALLDSESRSVDVGQIASAKLGLAGEDQPAQQEQQNRHTQNNVRSHFLLMAGFGLDAAVMQGVSKPLKHKIKQLAVGLSAARKLPEYRPFPVELYDANHQLLWQGEALQIVVGNTRLYADIFHMTPEAYIDDGQLDICVITAGNFLGTVQQIFSLLLRRQPDTLTAEFFKESRIFLKVPALTALQLDGSAVKLKEYLSDAEKQAWKTVKKTEKVMIEYCFVAVPQALSMTIPRTYDETLFEESGTNKLITSSGSPAPLAITETSAVSTPEAESRASSTQLTQLREQGRKITVVGTGLDVQHGVYIVAGQYTQARTGALKPVAVRVEASTALLNAKGKHIALASIQDLKEGQEIYVIGKKSKRGVIKARQLLV
jgi:YegS/Rv2252/BmrU family lipid kinase